MSKTISAYFVAVAATPLFGLGQLLAWLFFGVWVDGGHLILEDDRRVKIGGWRWWWYRLMLGYKTAERCPDCYKIIDSIHPTSLCECAYKLDMNGVL